VRRFVGHVFVCRQNVSASRDKTIKLWSTLRECEYDVEDGGQPKRRIVFEAAEPLVAIS